MSLSFNIQLNSLMFKNTRIWLFSQLKSNHYIYKFSFSVINFIMNKLKLLILFNNFIHNRIENGYVQRCFSSFWYYKIDKH